MAMKFGGEREVRRLRSREIPVPNSDNVCKKKRKRAPLATLTNLSNGAIASKAAAAPGKLPPPVQVKKSKAIVPLVHPEISNNTKTRNKDLLTETLKGSTVRNSKAIPSHEPELCSSGFIVSDDANQGDENVETQGWSCETYIDIDAHKDPQMCSTYAADIYHHLRMAELKRRPSTNFMELVQIDINASMRCILVDWLVEVAEEYKVVPDTLYLTISYIDRFLSKNVVNRQCLQLLGVTCMLIASFLADYALKWPSSNHSLGQNFKPERKYEEICPPQIEEFCYITDNTYTREEVLEMERRVLNNLQFELGGPTIKSFLRRFIRAAEAGQKTLNLELEFLGNYLAELTLVEYDFLKYLPSMVASAAVFMAKLILNPSCKPWNATLEHYTGYQPYELKECARAIYDLHCNGKNCTLPAIRDKYRQHKFKCVASHPPLDSFPLHLFCHLEEQKA